MWHSAFHQQLDLPETLTQGRERIYIQHFYIRLCYNPVAPKSRHWTAEENPQGFVEAVLSFVGKHQEKS